MLSSDMPADASSVALVVVQPTPFCNINCSYCYLPERANRAVMSLATVEDIFRQVFSVAPPHEPLAIVWHAGEPMVLPPAWYSAAFAVIDEFAPPQMRPRHRFQTNGMLLDDEWCRFLKTHADAVRVRVSIDGPEDIHDAHRRTRNGEGTFAKVMAGIQRLQAHGIDFGVISVLTARSLAAPEALFDFYESIGVTDIAFNFEEIEGANRTTSLSEPGAVERYKRFLRVFCALSRDRERDCTVRAISDAYSYLFEIEPPDTANVVAGRILSFDYRGGMSTFSPELLTCRHPLYGDFVLGNIRDSTIRAILNGDKAHAIGKDIADGVALCRSSCDYFRYCGGGAPSNKLSENGTFRSTETIHCRFRVKGTIDALLEDMRNAIGSPSHQSARGA